MVIQAVVDELTMVYSRGCDRRAQLQLKFKGVEKVNDELAFHCSRTRYVNQFCQPLYEVVRRVPGGVYDSKTWSRFLRVARNVYDWPWEEQVLGFAGMDMHERHKLGAEVVDVTARYDPKSGMVVARVVPKSVPALQKVADSFKSKLYVLYVDSRGKWHYGKAATELLKMNADNHPVHEWMFRVPKAAHAFLVGLVVHGFLNKGPLPGCTSNWMKIVGGATIGKSKSGGKSECRHIEAWPEVGVYRDADKKVIRPVDKQWDDEEY